MVIQVTFHGSTSEGLILLAIIGKNCSCVPPEAPAFDCPAHTALLHSQRFVDGVLTSRRRAADLWREEQCQPREVA